MAFQLDVCKKFAEHFHGKVKKVPPNINSPYFENGTEFQKKVWKLISAIPYGETRTYGELAMSLGSVHYARAVGGACNANPLALVIPCHRVVGRNSIGGFAGGITVKKKLLALEKEWR